MEPAAWEAAGEAHRERVATLAELGVMTASLLHELRQPLFAIMAHAELGLATAEAATAERLRVVLDQARHIEALLGQYSGIGRDGEVARFDLRAPVRGAAELFEYRARQLAARFTVEVAHGVVPVRAREHAVRQVVTNLLQNAFDAIEGVEQRDVAVSLSASDGWAVIEVRDSGCGVPDALHGRVFDAFVSSKQVGRGTGLGLYITRLIAERAGGEVTLEPAAPVGTLARVRLPISGS